VGHICPAGHERVKSFNEIVDQVSVLFHRNSKAIH
jgi:hypothetical protein